ncbi:MAG: hypothetical protein SchgKO_12700 [Schleiferiaceae bacterium]
MGLVRKNIYRIVSIACTLLIIGMSGGIHISKHFCRGELVDRSLNSFVEKCSADSSKSENTTPQNNETRFSKKSCCETEHLFLQTDHLSKQVDSPSLLYVSTTYFEWDTPVIEIASSGKTTPRPPPNRCGQPLYILHEQYLI